MHPSLWRQAQLCLTNGLFEVTEGIYQVRGFDLSNMSIIEGDTGVIVIDPLVSAECAAAGLALYRGHRGDKPITGVVYTHSHADHFGGVMGVLPNGAGTVPILAPEGFMEHAVSENVYVGPAMTRRANYMYVDLLDPSPTGQVSTGLGIRVSAGSVGLLLPTVDITRTGQEETIDGVRIVFQITPGTEAPAEMNFHFPDRRAPVIAENATHNRSNPLTLRGALARDPRIWSHYLNEAISGSPPTRTSYSRPTTGPAGAQRHRPVRPNSVTSGTDLHDQTLRVLNQGATARDSPRTSDCHPRWTTLGIRAATTAPSATTSRRLYQRYLGGSTGIRQRSASRIRVVRDRVDVYRSAHDCAALALQWRAHPDRESQIGRRPRPVRHAHEGPTARVARRRRPRWHRPQR